MKKPPGKYEITVVRTAYSKQRILVETDQPLSQEAIEKIACEKAPFEWNSPNEYASEYSVLD